MDFVCKKSYSFLAITCLSFVFIFLPSYPMMIDMPQHVAQLEVMKELIFSSDTYLGGFLEINWITTYLVGYLLALPLAFLLSSLLAIKITLLIAFICFIFFSKKLIEFFGADERFLMLVALSFFGISWVFGLFSFLTSVPIGLAYLVYTLKYFESGKGFRAILVFATLLFFAHGLTFPFFVSMAFFVCFIKYGLFYDRARVIFIVLNLIFATLWLVYFLYTKNTSITLGSASGFSYGDYIKRFVQILYSPFGATDKLWLPAISLFTVAAPFILGMRPSKAHYKYIPFVWVLLVWFAAPLTAEATTLLFNRWSILMVVFYLLIFEKCSKPNGALYFSGLTFVFSVFAIQQCVAAIGFNREIRGFNNAIASIRPEQKIASLMLDSDSDAAHMRMIYAHFGMYYQYLRHGLADPSFSVSVAPPVRYKNYFRPTFNEAYSWKEFEKNNISSVDFCSYDFLLFRSKRKIDISLYQKIGGCFFSESYNENGWRVFSKA